jgi:hypothetical protein
VFVEDREETKEERRARRKKSRWGGGEFDKTFIPGMPTILPSNLSKNQEKAYLRKFHDYFRWQLFIPLITNLYFVNVSSQEVLHLYNNQNIICY